MTKLLVDTSFLYALADPADKYREAALDFAQQNKSIRVIPDIVLTEVTYLIQRFISHGAVIIFLKALAASDAEIVSITKSDIERAASIMRILCRLTAGFC